MPKVAIIQQPPAVLDRVASLREAVRWIEASVAGGATLIVLSESFVPCYPAWIWRLRPGPDGGLTAKLHARLVDNAVSIGRGDLGALCTAARKHQVTIVCGMTERDEDWSRGTIYNTVVVIGPDGSLLNKHRKLMPTNPERMVWGFGDGSTLNVVDTPSGRVGTLLCWESYMPLARYSLYAQGVEVYIAPTYDSGDGWIGTMQHIAREGCCWVVGSGTLLNACPPIFPTRRGSTRMQTNGSRTATRSSLRPGGKLSSDHCARKPESSMPTSISTRLPRRGAASMSPATTRVRMSSACTSTGNASRRPASTKGNFRWLAVKSALRLRERSRRRRSRR